MDITTLERTGKENRHRKDKPAHPAMGKKRVRFFCFYFSFTRDTSSVKMCHVQALLMPPTKNKASKLFFLRGVSSHIQICLRDGYHGNELVLTSIPSHHSLRFCAAKSSHSIWSTVQGKGGKPRSLPNCFTNAATSGSYLSRTRHGARSKDGIEDEALRIEIIVYTSGGVQGYDSGSICDMLCQGRAKTH